MCLCVVVRFCCSARLGFCAFSVVRLLLVIYVFGARLGFVLGGVCVLCLLVCGDVFYFYCALGIVGFQCC